MENQLQAIEKYKEQVGALATLVLKGVDGDAEKATQGILAINNILLQNPKLIPFVADEQNRKEFEKLKMPKNGGVMELAGLFTQLQTLSKRFKNS